MGVQVNEGDIGIVNGENIPSRDIDQLVALASHSFLPIIGDQKKKAHDLFVYSLLMDYSRGIFVAYEVAKPIGILAVAPMALLEADLVKAILEARCSGDTGTLKKRVDSLCPFSPDNITDDGMFFVNRQRGYQPLATITNWYAHGEAMTMMGKRL